MTTEIFRGQCHIATLAKNGDVQAFDIYAKVPRSEINGETLKCSIDYPLREEKTFIVELYGSAFSDDIVNLDVVEIAHQVARQYLSVWKKNKKHFEGHGIGDLFIERMSICNGELIVEVGS